MADHPAELTDDEIVTLIRVLLGFDLPTPCIDGVRTNLGALVDHGARVLHD